MARIIWKGGINFGLVHVPVVVHPATRPSRLDFDWIDKRDNAPVGYQRINKHTGKPIDSEHIVKGYQYEKGEYVFMNDADFREANTAATQSVDILGFVDAAEVPIYFYDTPYFLSPDKRGAKGYALLHEALRKSARIGVASVVLHTKQHLAALLALDEGLMLITMRYAHELRPLEDSEAPDLGKTNKPTSREMDMAMRLIDDMTADWDPEQFQDTYRDDLLKLIDKKIKAGKTHELSAADEPAKPRQSAKIIDLVAVLQKSLDARGPDGKRKRAAADDDEDETPAKRASKKSSSRKTASPSGKRTSAAKKSSAARSSKAAAKSPRKTASATKRASKSAVRKAA